MATERTGNSCLVWNLGKKTRKLILIRPSPYYVEKSYFVWSFIVDFSVNEKEKFDNEYLTVRCIEKFYKLTVV